MKQKTRVPEPTHEKATNNSIRASYLRDLVEHKNRMAELQLSEIRKEWKELEFMIKRLSELRSSSPKDIAKILELDNLIFDKAIEYAKSCIYINQP